MEHDLLLTTCRCCRPRGPEGKDEDRVVKLQKFQIAFICSFWKSELMLPSSNVKRSILANSALRSADRLFGSCGLNEVGNGPRSDQALVRICVFISWWEWIIVTGLLIVETGFKAFGSAGHGSKALLLPVQTQHENNTESQAAAKQLRWGRGDGRSAWSSVPLLPNCLESPGCDIYRGAEMKWSWAGGLFWSCGGCEWEPELWFMSLAQHWSG